jgi:hypothetical protein
MSQLHLFNIVCPYLHTELVSLKEKHKLKTLMHALPPLSGAIIECRLGKGQDKVDFSLRATTFDHDREIFAGTHPFFEFPSHWLTEPIWKNIRKFSRQWLNPHSPIYHHVENIWLEFDSNTQHKSIPIPCIFFDVNGEKKNKQEWITDNALQILINKPFNEKIKNNLLLYLDKLPSNSQIHYIGAMMSRQNQQVRLNLLMDLSNILSYLTAIGHKRLAERLDSELKWIVTYSDRLSVNIDVHNDIKVSTLGLEIKPETKSLMLLLLDDLIKKELCTEQKRDALSKWPGQSPELDDDHIMKNVSLYALVPFKNSLSILNTRRINHIKIVFQPHGKIEAKAYLYVGYGWISKSKEGNVKKIQKNLT